MSIDWDKRRKKLAEHAPVVTEQKDEPSLPFLGKIDIPLISDVGDEWIVSTGAYVVEPSHYGILTTTSGGTTDDDERD